MRFDDEEESPGIKRGGVLNIVQHELELVCDAAHIPDEIHISLAGLDIGDSIHISQVTLPEGTKAAIDDRDFTVATIVAPSAVKAEEAEAAEAAAAEELSRSRAKKAKAKPEPRAKPKAATRTATKGTATKADPPSYRSLEPTAHPPPEGERFLFGRATR